LNKENIFKSKESLPKRWSATSQFIVEEQGRAE
jgi:hypothetical protein